MKPKVRIAVLAVVLVVLVAAVAMLARWGVPPPAPAGLPSGPLVPPGPSVAVPAADPAANGLAAVLDAGRSYDDRMAALHQLPENLTQAQCDGLRGLIKDPQANTTIRNDTVNLLARQELVQQGLVETLVAAWEDAAQPPLWRDFALQHLETVYDRAPGAEQQLAARTLEIAAGDPHGPSAGTALMSLDRLARRHPELTAVLDRTVAQATAAGGGDMLYQTGLMSVAINRGDRGVLPQARQLARDGGTAARLRLVSIGALGEMGDESDLATLEVLAKDKDSRLRTAATTQLAALRRRLGK